MNFYVRVIMNSSFVCNCHDFQISMYVFISNKQWPLTMLLQSLFSLYVLDVWFIGISLDELGIPKYFALFSNRKVLQLQCFILFSTCLSIQWVCWNLVVGFRWIVLVIGGEIVYLCHLQRLLLLNYSYWEYY